VRAEGVAAPVSRHDTEEEAEAAVERYSRGVDVATGGGAWPLDGPP
jgi:hypothetical protein